MTKKIRVLLAVIPALALLASCDDDSSNPGDTVSPRQVTNLTVTPAGVDSVRLQWTAPGDDGGSGTAQSYQFRRSDSAINGANFGSATVIPAPPTPAAGGTIQDWIIGGVDTALVTHFAMRASDDAGNVSLVSNDAVWPQFLRFVKDIPPMKDNTMYSEADTLSNGAGSFLFTGRNAIGNLRRALMAFAVVDSIPANAVIDSVQLRVRISQSPPSDPSVPVSLHRATVDWGEGASNAGSPGGLGAPAQTGDATWAHRFYDTITWATAGGVYAATASAQTEFGITTSFATFSSDLMKADVQAWRVAPASNFGWIVIGDETTDQTARRFDSSENPTAANRPRLRVFYSVVP